MKTITYGSMSSSVYGAVVHNLKYPPTTRLLMATYIPHHIIRTQFTESSPYRPEDAWLRL